MPHSPEKVGGRGARESAKCVGVCLWGLPAVGACRPLGLGSGLRRAPPRYSDAQNLPTREKEACQHVHHSTHTESALHSCALTCATHTHTATARVASLAHNPRRHVNGMEWNGMEWNGMEWNGMEWNEVK